MSTKEIVQRNLKLTLAHIKRVQENCLTLGNYAIEHDDVLNGIELVGNSLIHDQSKINDLYEREYFIFGNENVKKQVIDRHRLSNSHHPESWGGIHKMPTVYVMEMACDLKARSEEKGTDLRKWINEEGAEKYGFKVGDKFHTKLMSYIDILCEPPFERI